MTGTGRAIVNTPVIAHNAPTIIPTNQKANGGLTFEKVKYYSEIN